MTLSRIVPVALAIALAGCPQPQVVAPPIPTAFEGTVRDDTTGDALAGVSISTEPPTQVVTTDAAGKYAITTGLEKNGVYRVTGTLAGYLAGQATFRAEEGASKEVSLALVKVRPILELSRTSVDLGAQRDGDAFALANVGDTGTTLHYTLTKTADWLVLDSEAEGTVTERPKAILFHVVRSALGEAWGPLSTEISITTDGGTATLAVELEHVNPRAPAIAVTPASLDFGNVGDVRTFFVRNVGTGTLEWSLTSPEPWLTFEPSSGTLAYGPRTAVTVRVNRVGLADGTYTPSVAVTSSQSGVAAQQVALKVVAGGTPRPQLTPSAVDLGASGTTQRLELKNVGNGSMTFSVTPAAVAWLTLTGPREGALVSGASALLDVAVDRTKAAPGLHVATLTVTTSGGDRTVPIRIDVPERSVLAGAPTADAGASATTSYRLSNAGPGTLDWRLVSAPDWVEVTPTSGRLTSFFGLTPMSVDLALTVHRAGLTPGPLAGELVFTSTAGEVRVALSATVPVANWRKLNIAVPPPARRDPAMGWDPVLKRVVMFGGADRPPGVPAPNIAARRDTWLLDQATEDWTELYTVTAPGARHRAGMTWNSKRNALWMTGGQQQSGDYSGGGTAGAGVAWELVGRRWTAIPGVDPYPIYPGRSVPFVNVGPGTPDIGRLMLFGASNDPNGQTIKAFDPACTPMTFNCWKNFASFPRLMGDPVIAPYVEGGVDRIFVVAATCSSYELCNGLYVSDAVLPRAITGQTWSALPVVGDGANSRLNWTGFARNGEIFVYGGIDGTGRPSSTLLKVTKDRTAVVVPLTASPEPRSRARMAYDPVRDVAYLFGGEDAAGMRSDTWVLEFAR